MDCASYLSAVGSISALCFGIILCINLNNIAVFILFAACAFYDVCRLDSYLVAGIKALILLYGFFHKVGFFNVKLTAESNLSCAVLRTVRVVLNLKFFALSLGIVCNNKLNRL